MPTKVLSIDNPTIENFWAKFNFHKMKISILLIYTASYLITDGYSTNHDNILPFTDFNTALV